MVTVTLMMGGDFEMVISEYLGLRYLIGCLI